MKVWILLGIFLSTGLWAAPVSSAERRSYLRQSNGKLAAWEKRVERLLDASDKGRISSDEEKLILDLEVQMREIRGDLLKLAVGGTALWESVQPRVEESMQSVEHSLYEIR